MPEAALVFGNVQGSPLGGVKDLPSCFEARTDGVYIDPTQLPSPEVLVRAVDQMFSSGMVLRDLDYGCLQELLFDREALSKRRGFKLARCIEPMAEERKGLYRAASIENGRAEYVFEPVMAEREVNGRMVSEVVPLDADEFVASLWQKGVRFGLDVEAVKKALQASAVTRITIAAEKPVVVAEDGGVQELSPALHRSNAPHVLEDGRADLSQFANRFPQIEEGAALLKKTPPKPGAAGYTLEGKLVPPGLPKDFDLTVLAGEGTRIEMRGDTQVLVAAKNGFLNVDTGSNQLSISDKIVNREGVNARTTGNLRLQGDEYEEYGEVQEGRIVEGKHLSFHADVCGRVMSTGGQILIGANLVGGVALNRDGDIVIDGRASGAHVQVAKGNIRIRRAENTVVVGDRIELEEAIGCTLLADEIVVQRSEGCAMAGRSIAIGVATARGSEETLVSMLRPDLVAYDTQRVRDEAQLTELRSLLVKLKSGLEVITSQADFQTFLQTAGKLQRKELTLTTAQEEQWQQFKTRLSPSIKRASDARDDIKALESEIASMRAHLEELQERRRQENAVGRCEITVVEGDTRVRTYVIPLEGPTLTRLQPKELQATLRSPAPGEKKLFAGDAGTFLWTAE